ncbi:transient receptor potential cation channel protein painless-like isoform X2 [Eriocheir sinensis]|uniref:transient receptor potential cation channel protein painless-like isoform X2 n=1 Tax=Eriocheir sinensis TaxID=95602 RepID=UPI0021C61B4F|nr:transient receptor potential cation channel protein painless-like isoform X2 [Eriocheir sinensis]
MDEYINPSFMEENGRAAQEDHHRQMYVAVQTGDEARLRNALRHLSKETFNKSFPWSIYTALHLTAKNNFPKLVTALLEAGADPNTKNLYDKFCPLHYAAKNGNVEVVKTLLEKGVDPNAKAGCYRDTALHLLVKHRETDEDSYKACLDALLSCNETIVDVLNLERQSPLSMAINRGWEYMVKQLIYKGANIKATYGNKTAEDLIKNEFPGLLDSIDSSAIVEPQRHLSEELYNALIRRDIELFREILDEIEEDESQSLKSALEKQQEEYTLLMYACKERLTDFMKELLKRGADTSQEDQTSQMNPILYAAEHGYYEILTLLLLALRDQDDPNTDYRKVRDALKKRDDRGQTALHKIVRRRYDNKEEGVDYSMCLELLLDMKRLMDLDLQVELGYTEEQSQDLDAKYRITFTDKCLVDLDTQDELGSTALHYAVHFDDQSFVCKLLLSGASLTIKDKFGELAISRIQASVLEEVFNNCIKSRNNEFNDNFKITFHYSKLVPKQTSHHLKMYPETKFLMFLSDSHEHQHLLKHPVIDTLLSLKWRMIQKYYYINTLVYMAFLAFLTAYILLFHGNFTPSMDADPSGHNATANTGVPDPSGHNATVNTGFPDPAKDNMALKISLQVLISICTSFIAVREVTEFCISWRQYVERFKNWLEISIILLTCTVLFMPMEAALQQSMCAWLVLFSWIELVLVLGQHPGLSIYITMLSMVTSNFLKFIAMFSSMVVAFIFSFYLAFQVDENFTTTSFTPYHNSLLKTLTMATGEIEYKDLPLDAFPVFSHLLFVAFVFLIVLVLMNLLNGLAVSDIHKIQKEAEITSYRSRVELVSIIESGLLTGPLHQIFLWSLWCCVGGDDKYKCRCPICCPISWKRHSLARQLLNRLKCRAPMSQTCFNNKQTISMFPNNPYFPFQLTKAQIKAAKDAMLKKKQATANDRSGLEFCMKQLMDTVSSLKEKKVDKHVVLEKDLATANNCLDQLMDTVSSLPEKVDKHVVLEKDRDAANNRLSGLESCMNQLMDTISSLTEKVDKHVVLEKELATANNRLDQLMAAVLSLTEKVDKHVLCPSPQ